MFTINALASAAPDASTGSGMAAFLNFMPLILIFVVFYFLLIRPQQQQMKKHRAKVAAVKKGDQVVTGGGLVGKVVRVDDVYVDVELGQGIKVKAVKATLSDVVDPLTAKPAND
ncbi:preprotein translocase subunit YajC [Sphingobium lignivorans]|uniref:Sec translocon accessory complex subunit YajC n=1 Tax=Sphingobium lignivorans TaxID=2735886 RepID=A0ABR6NI89_9SPHN|nr:preprotein translocase subunit YajC [Sphingobium lignivorans]